MLNKEYANLKPSYLFRDVAQRRKAYEQAHPDKKVISLGIVDVTRPLPAAVVEAAKRAAEEMAHVETFRGYSPDQGYDFLREAIRAYYAEYGVALKLDEIFVSDGAKSDVGNLSELFDSSITALVPDPVYPVYVDSNIMGGRKVIYAPASAENGFLPAPPVGTHADLIYICSPNNPTGAAYDFDGLRAWVDYANGEGAVIIYDAAYEAFITTDDLPHSIYQIPGAEKCAIEVCSLSKTAGFTGVRCGYTIVPLALERDGVKLHAMWLRRQSTKFNGVSYIVQRMAEAAFSPEGRAQAMANLDYYRENARILGDVLTRHGITYFGGKSSPYLWLHCPDGMGSWEFYDELLNECQIVGTPGAGFGTQGEGWFRLTAFGERESVTEAAKRLDGWLK